MFCLWTFVTSVSAEFWRPESRRLSFRNKDAFFHIFPSVGKELLFRTREGDVVKLNVETNESTVLVPNRKFVSFSFYISK